MTGKQEDSKLKVMNNPSIPGRAVRNVQLDDYERKKLGQHEDEIKYGKPNLRKFGRR